MTKPIKDKSAEGLHLDTGCPGPGGCARTTGSSLNCDKPYCVYDDPAVIRQALAQARTLSIRNLLARGYTRREVAAEIGVSLGSVVKANKDHVEEA